MLLSENPKISLNLIYSIMINKSLVLRGCFRVYSTVAKKYSGVLNKFMRIIDESVEMVGSNFLVDGLLL